MGFKHETLYHLKFFMPNLVGNYHLRINFGSIFEEILSRKITENCKNFEKKAKNDIKIELVKKILLII